jgi:hypothetical protein
MTLTYTKNKFKPDNVEVGFKGFRCNWIEYRMDYAYCVPFTRTGNQEVDRAVVRGIATAFCHIHPKAVWSFQSLKVLKSPERQSVADESEWDCVYSDKPSQDSSAYPCTQYVFISFSDIHVC